MPTKGPLDRVAELRRKAAQLHADIAKGKSGDGLIKPDLRAQLEVVEGELRNLEIANKMYPTMSPQASSMLSGAVRGVGGKPPF